MASYFPIQTTIGGEYLLRLSNGQNWQLSYTTRVRSQVGQLGRIMELKRHESNGHPKLIFVRGRSGETKGEETIRRRKKDVETDLLSFGWKVHDLWLVRFWSHEDVPDLICEMTHEEGNYEQSILGMRLSLHPIYQRAQIAAGLPLHAGLVERNGKGFILAAPRNTGKTSCCHRLPSPWNAMCDEETLIVRNDQDQYLAHPFPTWSDYMMRRCNRTWDVQNYVPLRAIFFLEQGATDKVSPVGRGEATVLMNQSAMQVCHQFWNNLDRERVRTLKKKLFENACKLAGAIPTFKLRVSLKGRFWEEMEKALSETV